jgi:hypothetical protein
MKLPATILRTGDGQWSLRHESAEIGRVEVTAPTRERAVEKLCGEIRYRLELCPCSGETYQHIQIEIYDAPSTRAQSSDTE